MSVVFAKKARVDDGGKGQAAADDCDLAAEGRGKRAAAKSAAGVCALVSMSLCVCARVRVHVPCKTILMRAHAYVT